jgi:hypothetical protein
MRTSDKPTTISSISALLNLEQIQMTNRAILDIDMNLSSLEEA